MNPTHTISIKEDSGNPDKPNWRRIGAIFPNKSGNGGRVKWDEGVTAIPYGQNIETRHFPDIYGLTPDHAAA